MAYSPISDAEIEPGKPGSSGLFTKLRDNPEGIAAGLSGAPRIQDAAFAANTISGIKIINNTIVNEKIANDTIVFGEKINKVSVDLSFIFTNTPLELILSAGVYNIGGNLTLNAFLAGTLSVDCLINGVWVSLKQLIVEDNTVQYFQPLQVVSNGTDVKIRWNNTSSQAVSITLFYKQLM